MDTILGKNQLIQSSVALEGGAVWPRIFIVFTSLGRFFLITRSSLEMLEELKSRIFTPKRKANGRLASIDKQSSAFAVATEADRSESQSGCI